MIRTLICDDESDARDALRSLLTSYCPEVKIIAEANRIESAIEQIHEFSPELVFLDIQMQGGTGFDVLKAVEPFSFQVIFVTAFQQYSMEALKVSALDYLLKPVDRNELVLAVKKAELAIELRKSASPEKIIPQADVTAKILVHNVNGFHVVNVADIIRCEADRNYTTVFLKDGVAHIASRGIKEFESLLSGSNFMRVHKSHLINLSKVVKFIKLGDGKITLEDGSEVELARGKKEEFIQRLTGKIPG